MNGTQKTKQRQNTKPEEVVVEEVVTETTPERKAGYESLNTPTGMTNDAMSGWRTQLGTMNGNYQYIDANGNTIADIRGFGNSKEFKDLDVTKQNQYYTDLANFNALYNNVAGYDADYLKEAEKAKQAEEYANTRRMLMERYMPETLAAMGYANTGLAGDAVLKINNKYDNYILGAQKEASDNQSDLMTAYRNKAMEIESGINAEKQSVLQAQQDLYNEYLTKIYKGEGLDAAGVEAAVKLGALTPEQAEKLKTESSGWTAIGQSYVEGTGDNEGKRIDLKESTSDQTITAISPQMSAAKAIETMKSNGTEVNTSGDRQEKFLTSVLNESSKWSNEMNGTLVDFNYGWTTKDNEAGSIYVFYNGNWYLTNLSRNQLDDDEWEFYSAGYRDIEGKDSWVSKVTGVRGTNFYRLVGNANYKPESKTETK